MSAVASINGRPQSIRTLLSLTPVRGLVAAKKIMEEINRLVLDITVKKSECKALVGQASDIINIIESIYNTTSGVQLKHGVLLLDVTLAAIRKDMQYWRNYSRVKALSSKYLEMPYRLRIHRENLDKAMASVKSAGFSRSLFTDKMGAGSSLSLVESPVSEAHSWAGQTLNEPGSSIGEHSDGETDNFRLPLMTISSRLSKAVFPCETERLPGIYVSRTGCGPSGRGGWSDVWRGELHDEERGTSESVAVKIFSRVKTGNGPEAEHAVRERLQKRMHREVHAWHGLDHPRIAPLRGFALESDGTPWLVSPWFSNGDVISYVRGYGLGEEGCPLDRWKLVRQVAEGLTHLHSQQIVHGDLKGSNVLIDSDGDVALCDFGISRRYKDCTAAYNTTNVVMGAPRWCAPEVIDDPSIDRTEASDVYAFASLSLEILTGHPPFRYMDEVQAQYVILEGLMPEKKDYPELPVECGFWDILERCWKLEPSERPKMSDLVPKTFNKNM